MGADYAYIGSPFIATHEARAVDGYKEMIASSGASDIVYSNYFTGIHGNYLKGSVIKAGMDPDNLPEADPSKMDFAKATTGAKAWKDIWGAGQGIGRGGLLDEHVLGEREHDRARSSRGCDMERA